MIYITSFLDIVHIMDRMVLLIALTIYLALGVMHIWFIAFVASTNEIQAPRRVI